MYKFCNKGCDNNMIVGIPKALLYWKYNILIQTFLKELGIQYIISPDTNKEILDAGVKYAVDEACLPIKIFHGHVNYLRDKCDVIIVPRIMELRKREFICPKFCGLPEMIKNSFDKLPQITEEPIYAASKKELYGWFKNFARKTLKYKKDIISAFDKSINCYMENSSAMNDTNYKVKVALLGHPYNIYDKYCNLDIVEKLHNNNIGVITEEYITEEEIDNKVNYLFKKPFWTFARNIYGSSVTLVERNEIDGLVYISSFACGIDSVVIELVKDKIGNIPFLILKIDEHSGEAGIETRIEAFGDMLERRKSNDNNLSKSG